ncbi:MAG: class I SAM-dependent methyltransferase [Planctomycetota bacterium]|jgi:SAM-dependent methyltransferase
MMLEKTDPNITGPIALREYYDDRHSPRIIRESERFYKWVLDRAALAEGDSRTLLDIGCGGGYLLREAALRGLRPVGCDISTVAAKVAAGTAGCGIIACNAENLPFADARFDVVTNLGNLEHFLDMRAGVGEMKRVVKPEGSVLVLVPNSRYSGDIWRWITRGQRPTHHQAIERFGSEKEWRRLLEEGGLTVRNVFRYDKFKTWKRVFPRRYSYCFLFICRRGNRHA